MKYWFSIANSFLHPGSYKNQINGSNSCILSVEKKNVWITKHFKRVSKTTGAKWYNFKSEVLKFQKKNISLLT